MSELKPCPFCGQPAVCEKMMIHYRVRCENDCSGCQHKRDAIMKWNTRANSNKKIADNYDMLLKFVRTIENDPEYCWTIRDLLKEMGMTDE